MGETGPCGPCTEIHWFNGDASGGVPYDRFGEEPTPDGIGLDRDLEPRLHAVRALDRATGEATLAPLPKPCVDTGTGLERIASVLQGVTSNYDTDLLRALVDKASEISGKRYARLAGRRRRLDARHRRPRAHDGVPRSPRASSPTAPGASTCCAA